ncbi:MAG: substrate-binding domain-containing protein [Elusimicrobia bacterium]|nr:substrate-binding domain-containing protein [Elusimicrobiota bacterium]
MRTAFLLLAAAAASAAAAAPRYAVLPPGRDSDVRVFEPDGRVLDGAAALAAMSRGTGLSLWLAGNQFFAMKDVVAGFRRADPKAGSVAVMTLPPGLLLQAILKGGWNCAGKDYALKPDVYSTVDLAHLRALKARGLAKRYFVYTRNELALMVAAGNPKRVKGIADLARPDLRVYLPNPRNEGIMSVYGRKVLERHGLYRSLTGGKECAGCRATPRVYLTAVHHRETPAAIAAGRADVGLVWRTENENARRAGLPVQGVSLPPRDSERGEAGYEICALTGAAHPAAARAYLSFLKSAAGQRAYAAFGFIPAARADLRARAIR